MPSVRVRGAALAAALAVSALPAVLLTGPAPAREAGVNVGPGFVFNPKDRFIEVGDTVVWTHRDGDTPHTVESTSSEQFDSSTNCPAVLPPGDCMTQNERSTFSHQFNTVGDFAYRCELHEAQGMVGTIHVKPKPTATATATRTRAPPPPTATSSSGPTGTPTGTAGATASPGVTATATSSTPGVAAPETDDGSKSAAVPIAAAILSLVVLGGAAYLVWRRFFASG